MNFGKTVYEHIKNPRSWYLFHEVGNATRLCCENYYDLRKQLQSLTIFAKRFIVDVWQHSEFDSDFEYVSVLNIRGFWIYQACHNARFLGRPLNMSELHRVLNMPQCLNDSWICVIMPECAWICLNGFCFTFTHWNYRLFYWKVKVWFFSIVTGSIWFCLLF